MASTRTSTTSAPSASLTDLSTENILKIFSTMSAIILPEQKPNPTSKEDLELLEGAKISDPDMVDRYLILLGDKVFTLTDGDGNTFLHLAARHNSPSTLQHILNKLGKKALAMCKIANNHGLTPLLLAHDTPNGYPRNAVIKILLPHSLDHSIKPLSTLLDANQILNRYPETESNPALADTLKLACKLINKARTDVLYSTSHPEVNDKTNEELSFIDKQLEKVRRYKIYERVQDILDGDRDFLDIIRRYRTANCLELSFLILIYLRDTILEKDVRIEIVRIENGDHVFVILNRAIDSKLEDFNSYGPQAVFMDTWAGHTMPVLNKEFQKKLQNYYNVCYNDQFSYSLLANLNFSLHKLVSIVDLTFSPVKPYVPVVNTEEKTHPGFFEQSKKDSKGSNDTEFTVKENKIEITPAM